MKALEVRAEIDRQHRLQGTVPPDLRPRRVRVIILVPEEEDVGEPWKHGVARQWATELGDVRENIYTGSDGEPEDAAG